MRRLPLGLLLVAALTMSHRAAALDKQGSAHGGGVPVDEHGFDVTGAATMGIALYNPSYAARPDNTGKTLMRYAVHVDIDLLGSLLSIPIDLNMFSDRERAGAKKLAPTEFDVIGGLTSTIPLLGGGLEIGARVEHDRPLDTSASVCASPLCTQTYADVRLRYLYSFAKWFPRLGPALADGDVSGWLTLGWFAVNPSYAARPDNTDHALFRYGLHTEVSLLGDHLSFGLDLTSFTARETKPFRPTELDVTWEIIGRRSVYEVHLAYERDVPLDRPGLVQAFVYALFGVGFDLVHGAPPPLERRGTVLSP